MRTKIFAVALSFCATAVSAKNDPETQNGWHHYGGSLAGSRYLGSANITPESVSSITPAWEFQTGDATDGEESGGRPSRFRATPIMIDGRLFFSTGFNRVFALDAGTGQEIWSYDPKVDFSRPYSEMFTSRGVATWQSRSNTPPTDACSTRIFMGTLDARLIALDAATGQTCKDFGSSGEIDLSEGVPRYRALDYSVTSPPLVMGDLVIVGSSIGDNGAAELEPGFVRAYNVLSGKLVWTWDPIPREPNSSGAETWLDGAAAETGGANVWSIMAGDPERDIVYLPTTSPSPDFYGGKRLGDNAFANSMVALKASTGEFLWGYQTVRHDLWDLDLAAQPLLFDLRTPDGTVVPAIAQATKMGFVFVLNRKSGQPLHTVTERAVPQTDVAGEQTASHQKFPRIQLHETDARPLKLWQFSEDHVAACTRMLEGVRYEGLFTPPSLEGTLLYPGNGGGTNWGSMAYDKTKEIAYLTVNRLPTIVKLIPRRSFRAARKQGTLNGFAAQHTSQSGTPYGMARRNLQNPSNGLPCLEGPWATLVAINLNSGEVVWEIPAGTIKGLKPPASNWGAYASGGPIVTAGGVVFLASPTDRALRAYDGQTGSLVWESFLPAGAHATPMAYHHEGYDYVVVTAGDQLAEGRGRGDHVIAFRLKTD